MDIVQDCLWHEPDGTSVGIMLDALGKEVSIFSDSTRRVLRPSIRQLVEQNEIVVVRNHPLPSIETKALASEHFSHTEPLFWHQDDSDFGDAVVLHKEAGSSARKGETWFGSYAKVSATINSIRKELASKFPELVDHDPLSLIHVYSAIVENYDPDFDETINRWIKLLSPDTCYKHIWREKEPQTTITLTPKANLPAYSCHARIANRNISTDSPLKWEFARF